VEPVRRRRCAVLGSPIAHSLSPVLHRAAYDALGLDWSYDAVEVSEDGLPGFLDGLDGSWRGLSLTMPLKRTVVPLLDEMSARAAQARAANTVVLDAGRRVGHNTDIPGAVSVRTFADVVAAGEPLAADIVVSTVPAAAQTEELVALTGPVPVVFEVVYDPWPTPLAAHAQASGRTLVSGLDLLVHQAALQVTLMTGAAEAPLAAMRLAGERALTPR